jgi:hypothetical protein
MSQGILPVPQRPKLFENHFSNVISHGSRAQATVRPINWGDRGLERLLAPPEDTELLQDEIGGFFVHAFNLGEFDCQSQFRCHQRDTTHTASAPEMISISSLVIMAWRVRL